LPLEDVLRPLGINHLVPGIWDRGAGPRLLAAPGLPPIAPLICYEAIFSGETIQRGAADRPLLLLNVTNDGWFGHTTGPYQHLAQARLRASKKRHDPRRHTGVSAIIDAYGRSFSRCRSAKKASLTDVCRGRRRPPSSPRMARWRSRRSLPWRRPWPCSASRGAGHKVASSSPGVR
jgi:apolipoprotein N-acyltransferase